MFVVGNGSVCLVVVVVWFVLICDRRIVVV